jgi:hypothetical protein
VVNHLLKMKIIELILVKEFPWWQFKHWNS